MDKYDTEEGEKRNNVVAYLSIDTIMMMYI